jgi:hypothetical protein
MESDSYSVFESANELRICHGRWRGEMAGPNFTVDRQESAEGELKSAAVAPGTNRVGEGRGMGAALEAKAGKAVGHDAFSKAGIDRSEQEVGVRGPDQIGGPLRASKRVCRNGRDP